MINRSSVFCGGVCLLIAIDLPGLSLARGLTPTVKECVKQNLAKSELAQDLAKCQDHKTKDTLDIFFKTLQNSKKSKVCFLDQDHTPTDRLLTTVCKDPVGYVCQHSKGSVINSDCDISVLDSGRIRELPSYIQFKCGQINKKKPNYLKIATPELKARLQSLFDRTKEILMSKIKDDDKIPRKYKQILFKEVSKTRLRLMPELCLGLKSKNLPEFNTTIALHGSEVVFCAGALLSAEYHGDLDLVQIMGHELMHSIDPCTLESKFSPILGDSFYPGLSACLRGGSGPEGCVNGVLHCNDKKYYQTQVCKNEFECVTLYDITPSCPHGSQVKEYSDHLNDLSYYRKAPDPVSQLQEGFADFSGAELTAAYAAKYLPQFHADSRSKLNALVNMATGLASLHGICLEKNTNDPHPPGKIRMNQLLMRNKGFRALFCEGHAYPKQAAGVKPTCELF